MSAKNNGFVTATEPTETTSTRLIRPDANPYSSTRFESEFTEANFTFRIVYNTFNRFMTVYCKDEYQTKEIYVMFPFPDVWIRPIRDTGVEGIAAVGNMNTQIVLDLHFAQVRTAAISICIPQQSKTCKYTTLYVWMQQQEQPEIARELLKSVTSRLNDAIVELVMSV